MLRFMKAAQPQKKSSAIVPERAPASAAINPSERPKSATNGWIVTAGFVAFVGSLWLVR
jgi:hypothetical protein